MTNEPSVADVLRTAAQVMSERGQCKRSLTDHEGRVCLYGAKGIALARLDVTSPAVINAVNAAIHFQLPAFAPDAVNREFPAVWNDSEATQTEVEKFFLWAADRVEFGDAS